jgi:hypothetical protein
MSSYSHCKYNKCNDPFPLPEGEVFCCKLHNDLYVKDLEELNEIYKGFLDKMASPPYWDADDYMTKLRYEYTQLKKLREKLDD